MALTKLTKPRARWATFKLKLAGAISRSLYDKLAERLSVKDFGAKGDNATDDTAAIQACLNAAPKGGTVYFPTGNYKITKLVNPPKSLIWQGEGLHSAAKGEEYGTVLISTLTDGSDIIEFPPPTSEGHCRFSEMRDITVYGSGTTDSNGTGTAIRINNQGTHLSNVQTRYVDVGVECNTSTGQKWSNCTLMGKTHGVLFRVRHGSYYSPTVWTSWATANTYDTIRVHTSTTEVNAVGWFVDATCQYGQNTHINVDFESCYVGSRFDGRLSSKDYPNAGGSTISVYGAAGWQGSGNEFIGCWWERNTGDNIQLVHDTDTTGAALVFRSIFQDSHKVSSSTGSTNNALVYTNAGTRKLKHGKSETPTGQLGEWGSPLTAHQYLLNGSDVNAPTVRSKANISVPYTISNRTTKDSHSTYEFDVFVVDTPNLENKLAIATISLQTYKSMLLEITAAGTTSGASTSAFKEVRSVFMVNSVLTEEVLSRDATTADFLRVTAVSNSNNKVTLYASTTTGYPHMARASFNFKLTFGGDRYGDMTNTVVHDYGVLTD